MKRCSAVIAMAVFATLFVPSTAAVVYAPGAVNFSTSGQSMFGPGITVVAAKSEDSTTFGGPLSVGGFTGGLTMATNPLWLLWQACNSVDIFGLCGDAPDQYLFVDTTTGAKVEFVVDGSIGYHSSFGVIGGSIDAALQYDVSLALPEPGSVVVGESFDLAPRAALIGGNLDTRFPTLTADVGVDFDLFVSAAATGCFVGACTSGASVLADINLDIPILELNTPLVPDAIRLFGLPPDPVTVDLGLASLFFDAEVPSLPSLKRWELYLNLNPGAFPLATSPNGPPAGPATTNIAELTFDMPDLGTSGSLSGGTIVATEKFQDVLDLNFDIDGFLAWNNLIPPIDFGVSLGDVTLLLTYLDVDVGPTVDLEQAFELIPRDLRLRLDFDRPVLLGNGTTAEWWMGNLLDLPLITLLDDTAVTVVPTFYAGADLASLTNLDVLLELSGNILAGGVSFHGLNPSIGPLERLETSKSLGTVALFEDTFDLGGFDSFQTPSFTLRAVPEPTPRAAPEPASVLLTLVGLSAIASRRRRR